MVKDAEKNAAEDKKRREEIDARNRLDSMTYEVEKNAKEWSDKLAAELKTRLDAAVERARKALRGDDMNEIKAAQEELQQRSAKRASRSTRRRRRSRASAGRGRGTARRAREAPPPGGRKAGRRRRGRLRDRGRDKK